MKGSVVKVLALIFWGIGFILWGHIATWRQSWNPLGPRKTSRHPRHELLAFVGCAAMVGGVIMAVRAIQPLDNRLTVLVLLSASLCFFDWLRVDVLPAARRHDDWWISRFEASRS